MSAEEYGKRFSRNIGIVSISEQNTLKAKSVAVAGVGGLGGQALINLTRMGIGRFSIADIDVFDIPNTNRQIGASHKTLGRTKVEVMTEMIQDISPGTEVREFRSGITPDTVDEFVTSCDIVVDSLDFFCLSARRLLYDACARHGKTVILSAPLGFSATLHVFSPTSMTADQYFNWRPGMSKFRQMIHFSIGIAPAGLHLRYLKLSKEMLVERGTGPSIATGCTLGGSLVASEVLIAILNRRPLFQAPTFTQFDPYVGVYRRRRLLFGNRGLFQRIKIAFANKYYGELETRFLEFIK